MKKIAILCVEDEPEVRESIMRELRPFRDHFRLEAAEDAAEATEVMALIENDGDEVGLILCDHRLPGASGVDFLVGLHGDETHAAVRKVLVTGQAGQQDTIRAINEAGLDQYIAKPWAAGELVATVRKQMTEFLLSRKLDGLPYLSVLEDPRLLTMGRIHSRAD